MRLIPNRVTKITSFEAHVDRKPNTALSNIVTKTSKNNLSYNNFKNFASDRRLLMQPVLTPAAMRDMEQDSEKELNVQHKQPTQKDPHTVSSISTESEDSENEPLLSPTRTPGKITPSKIEIPFGDKNIHSNVH